MYNDMKILVVGSGGREHAIIKKLKENSEIEKIYALPGNGGIAADAECVPIGATDIPAITAFASENAIDYAVVAPDDPLVLGCVDALEAVGIPCFGPRKAAAAIEGSKAFAKELMNKYPCPNLPSAGHNAHGRFEYAPVESLKTGVRIIRELLSPALVESVILKKKG